MKRAVETFELARSRLKGDVETTYHSNDECHHVVRPARILKNVFSERSLRQHSSKPFPARPEQISAKAYPVNLVFVEGEHR